MWQTGFLMLPSMTVPGFLQIHVTANAWALLLCVCLSLHFHGRGWLAKPITLFCVPERGTRFLEHLKLFTGKKGV